eukprot:1156369-Pelagomonas_calceolata.AAC.13
MAFLGWKAGSADSACCWRSQAPAFSYHPALFLVAGPSFFSACRTSLSLNFVLGWSYGVHCPLTDSRNFVGSHGAGITNTICRAELAAIAAAITHSYSHIQCAMCKLLQTVSPLFIKYVNNPFTLRNTNKTFKGMYLKSYPLSTHKPMFVSTN